MSFGIFCPSRSHRRLFMWGAICCNVFSLKWDEMWPAGSLQWKHNGKGSREFLIKINDCDGERLLWNSHELSSISWAERGPSKQRAERSLTYTGRVMICFSRRGFCRFLFIFLWGTGLHCVCNIAIQFNYRLTLDEGVWTVSKTAVN